MERSAHLTGGIRMNIILLKLGGTGSLTAGQEPQRMFPLGGSKQHSLCRDYHTD